MDVSTIGANTLEKCKNGIRKYKYIAVMLVAGVLLLCTGNPSTAPPDPIEPVLVSPVFSAESFAEQLTNTLSCIANIGQVQVMVTLEDDGERVYATDTRTSETSDETSIATMSDGSYGQIPVERYATYPSVRGVAVVCQGAGQDAVKLAVLQAVTALCDIDSTQVTILQMG